MKKLTIELHKSGRSEEGSKIFMRAIQEVGVTTGMPPMHGAFLEDGFEKLFTGFLAIEGYLLAFMDQNMKVWNERDPGRLCSFSFDEDDFKNGVLDEEKVLEKMSAAESSDIGKQSPSGFCRKCNQSTFLKESLREFKNGKVHIEGCCPICSSHVKFISKNESLLFNDLNNVSDMEFIVTNGKL